MEPKNTPLRYNTEPTEDQLTVLKDVSAQYTGLPHDRVRPFNYDAGFVSDVKDEFALSWLGQLIHQERYDDGFQNKPIDLDYDPFDPENLAGFEEYASAFKYVKNKEHHEFIKDKITLNNQRRFRLESSDRSILPALVAGLGDPVNYIPIPFVKGIGFGARFVKGGAVAAGLVGATEPIRRSLDPTSSNIETAGYLGGSFLLGGLFTGAFGKRIASETIQKKGGVKELSNKYFTSFHKTEGRKTYEADGFNYKVGDDNFNTKVKEDVKTNKTENGRYKPVHFQKGTKGKDDVLAVDTLYLRNIYNQGLHLFSKTKGVLPLPREVFRTAQDYIDFMMKKEIYRGVYKEFKRGKGEKLVDYENRLNTRVLDDLKKDAETLRSTDTNRIFESIEALTNYGKVMKAFKDPYYAKQMQKLAGDFSTGMRGNRIGVPTENSAMLDAMTFWFQKLDSTLRAVGDDFVAYRTGNANSLRMLNMNISKGGIRAGDMYNSLLRKINSRNARDVTKYTEPEFRAKVTQAVGDDTVFNDAGLDPFVKQAATRVRTFYRDFGKEAEKLEMFASQGAFRKLMAKIDGVIKDVDDDIAKTTNPVKLERLKKLKLQLQKRYRNVKEQADELQEGVSPPYTQQAEYFNRIWRRDKILKEPEVFKAIIRNWYTRNPIIIKKGKVQKLSTNADDIEKRVNDTFDRIVGNEANHADGDGFAGWGLNQNNQWKAGVRPLMSRALDIPNKEVMDFIETDITVLMRQYQMRMSNAVEITRQFGDKHMEVHLYQMERRLINKELKVDGDNAKIDKVLNAFEDEKDKLLGSINTEDPSSLSKRTASFLRDWASLAFMGKVIFSALVDTARPIMVNGIHRTFKDGLGNFVTNNYAFSKALEQVRYFAPAMEVTMSSTRKRYIEDGGQVGVGKGFLNSMFDRVALKFNQAQQPFYYANLLTPWTQMWKEFQGVVSQHRFIEDCIKVSKGQASEFDIRRLASYGIDEKTAKLIADMPYESMDGLYLPNANAWATKTGGQQAARKFRQALFADVNRTIITPSTTDQFNMMHGVFRIDSKAMNNVLDNSFGRFMGYQKTERGGKVSNAYLGLPFQFFSWAVAANRKLLISGMQGREANAMAGVLGMVSMGMLGDYFKNPRYWEQKPLEEKILRGVELSGVLGLFGDMNFMLETISGGMFDNAVGVRPALGIDLRFGDPDMADAVGEFTGAGPSIPIDLLHAFLTDQDYDDKAATLRRIIPLNTLWIWDRTFKNLYDAGAEQLK